MRKVNLKNEAETRQFAISLAKEAQAGSVYALIGDLGTGKTTFTKGFAEGLGVLETVGSPTFKLVSEYTGSALNLYHIDCYRLQNEDEFLNIDGERFLVPEDGVTLIEWADRIDGLLDESMIFLHFDRIPGEETQRIVKVSGEIS